jgi:hypothetical protein
MINHSRITLSVYGAGGSPGRDTKNQAVKGEFMLWKEGRISVNQ